MADRPRPGVVVVTHGQLATELLNAAEMIVGDLPALPGRVDRLARRRDGRAGRDRRGDCEASIRGAGVLILTDMFGGTPSNLGLAFLEAGRVEVVTGVNLGDVDHARARRPTRTICLTRARKLRDHGRPRSGWRPICCDGEREPDPRDAA